MRAALYARFSTDLQNSKSADDQISHLRHALAAKGWREVAVYKDEGISGAQMMTRPGLLRLMADAQAKAFDAVFSESMDRISRDQADTAQIFKTLRYLGIELHTTSEGHVSILQAGFAGMMNQVFLDQLADKTRRGQIANVKAGKSGGGNCFGYRTKEGVLSIDPEQADIVRLIFAEYDRGISPRKIATRLNADGLAGPRGGEWTSSTINGDRRVGDGILHQPLYNGELVFNRRRFRKHPESGRRSSVINPQADWVHQEMAHLRIVDKELWDRVQSRNAALSEAPNGCRRRPKRLLSGLMTCSECGGSMTLQGRDRYACSAHRERGTCSNGKIIAAETVERRVLVGVRDALLAPALIEEAMRAYERELADHRSNALRQRSQLERELTDVEGKLDRQLDLYEGNVITKDKLKERICGLEDRAAAIKRELAGSEAPTSYTLHPRAVERYKELVGQLHSALAEEDAQAAREAFRGLLDGVVFTPGVGKGEFQLELHGRLAALLVPQTHKTPQAMTACGVKLGAGTGFEPVTFRL